MITIDSLYITFVQERSTDIMLTQRFSCTELAAQRRNFTTSTKVIHIIILSLRKYCTADAINGNVSSGYSYTSSNTGCKFLCEQILIHYFYRRHAHRNPLSPQHISSTVRLMKPMTMSQVVIDTLRLIVDKLPIILVANFHMSKLLFTTSTEDMH